MTGLATRALAAAFKVAVAVAAVAAGAQVDQCEAQRPPRSISLGFGVDTTIAEVRQMVNLTKDYFQQPDTTAAARGLWRGAPDLAVSAYLGAPATIIGITSAVPGDSVFAIRVLHASTDSTGKISVLAMQRLHAVRAPAAEYGWVLESPRLRETAHWTRRQAGRVTFSYAPGQVPSERRVAQVKAFVDSVADMFGIASRPPLHAYIAGSTEEAMRVVGLEYFPDGSGPGNGLGGRAYSAQGILLLGDPRFGEAYLHEFVHAVIGNSIRSYNAVFGEGLATWLGGGQGSTLPALYSSLVQYQHEHPQVSLEDVLNGEAPGGRDATSALYASSALIIHAIYERAGVDGLRRFAEVRGTAAELLKVLPRFVPETSDASKWWRSDAESRIKTGRLR